VVARILREHNIRHVFGIQAAYVWALETGFHEYGIKRILICILKGKEGYDATSESKGGIQRVDQRAIAG